MNAAAHGSAGRPDAKETQSCSGALARPTPGSLRRVRLVSKLLIRRGKLPVARLDACRSLAKLRNAWRDFETAPIVVSLPARPYVPSIQNCLAELRRKLASINPLPINKLCKTPHVKRVLHNLPERFSRLLEQEQLQFSSCDKCCSTHP